MMRRALVPLVATVPAGLGVAALAHALDWSTSTRYVVVLLTGTLVVALGLPYALLRQRLTDDPPVPAGTDFWKEASPLLSLQHVRTLSIQRTVEDQWFPCLWSRVPVRTGDDPEVNKRIDLRPIEIVEVRDAGERQRAEYLSPPRVKLYFKPPSDPPKGASSRPITPEVSS